jgi:hypothetical protein
MVTFTFQSLYRKGNSCGYLSDRKLIEMIFTKAMLSCQIL